MRVPVKWLHEYCAPDLDAFALAERLAMTGTEVERVERHGVTALEHFVVGKVLEAEQHPDADRLRVCQVDTGDGEPSQIVCGAPNVAAGQTVAVAKPGSVMPDGTKLKVAKLRGQASNGMILAEDEVGIGARSRRHHGPRRRAGGGHAARVRAAHRDRRARPRGDPQPAGLPGHLRRRARGARRHRRPAGPGAVEPRTRRPSRGNAATPRGSPSSARTCAPGSPRGSSRT